MWGDLHEEKEIVIRLPQMMSSGKANRLLRELGATLHYDVYNFAAKENETWQSESVLDIELWCNGSEVDAQNDVDEIHASYPFASRPSSDQSEALKLLSKIVSVFGATASYQGKEFTPISVQEDWDSCNDFLLKEWGEEPGSNSLAIMIEENHA